MAFDYGPVAATAVELIAEFGRAVTLVQLNATSADAAMPWLGAVDPRGAPAATLSTIAAFVEPESMERLGQRRLTDDQVKKAQQVMIIATSVDLSAFTEVIDGSSRWKVVKMEILKPGPVQLLAFVWVGQRVGL